MPLLRHLSYTNVVRLSFRAKVWIQHHARRVWELLVEYYASIDEGGIAEVQRPYFESSYPLNIPIDDDSLRALRDSVEAMYASQFHRTRGVSPEPKKKLARITRRH